MSGTGSLGFEQIKVLEEICNKISYEPKIRFCGIINSMGKIVAGGFKDNIKPLDNDDQRQMLYMQSRLEISMKGEFNENLGNVNHIVTYRDNIVLINMPIPKYNHLALISAERNASIEQIIKMVASVFESHDIFDEKPKMTV
ncbi:DUF6659 family protein [Nitrosopumilus sp.]|uniref:DUF6659 family protein n=1 Tax=Nitrosopumilus sp. TaxID=2024843 RepID=UPI003B5C0628